MRQWLKRCWDRRGLQPGDPATPEWREYRRECRRIARANAGPGGYQGYPLPPGATMPPIPAVMRSRRKSASEELTQ